MHRQHGRSIRKVTGLNPGLAVVLHSPVSLMDGSKAIITLKLYLHLLSTRPERHGTVKKCLHAFLTSALDRVLDFTCRLFQPKTDLVFSTAEEAVWAPQYV